MPIMDPGYLTNQHDDDAYMRYGRDNLDSGDSSEDTGFSGKPRE